MKKFGMTMLVLTALVAAGYTMYYFALWEWNRAMVTGMLLLAVEVALAVVFILRRLERLEPDRDGPAGGTTPDRPAISTAQDATPAFAWLATPPPGGNTYGVFIPILMGSGLLVSAVTWLLQRVSERTADPRSARELPRSVQDIAFPDVCLVPDDHELRAHDARGDDDANLRLLVAPIADRRDHDHRTDGPRRRGHDTTGS